MGVSRQNGFSGCLRHLPFAGLNKNGSVVHNKRIAYRRRGVFCRPVLRCLRLYTHLFQDMFYPSRDAEWLLEDWWKKSYYDKLNFYAQMVRKGREKEFEWLRDQLLNMAPHTGGTVLPNNTEAKKPNIYLYPETETGITVTFEKPEYLTSSIPDYRGAWTVTASPDGKLTDTVGNSYGYLFYGALVKKKTFQTEEGFLIPADNRDETFRRILTAYGFNEQETADFIEYWLDYLKGGTDYLMYPMLTDGVDAAMPVSFSVNPDSITRIWFGFAHYDGSEIKKTRDHTDRAKRIYCC